MVTSPRKAPAVKALASQTALMMAALGDRGSKKFEFVASTAGDDSSVGPEKRPESVCAEVYRTCRNQNMYAAAEVRMECTIID